MSWEVEALEALAIRFTRGCSPRAVSIHSRAIFNNGPRTSGSSVMPASLTQSRAYPFIALSVATAASKANHRDRDIMELSPAEFHGNN